MAEMTLQPTDVEILEEWIRAWRFAVGVLHMVSAKAMGVPSTDLEYRQLLQEINDVLYAKTGGALYYGAPGPIVDASTEILMAVKGIDPSQTALVGASPVTDVTTTAVEVGGAIATTGAGLFSKVGRKILISSIVAALGLQTLAGLLPQEQKTDLYTSLDPYADEDGNVLVHTDSDGTTRVPKSYVEAVRQKLIGMHAYDTLSPTPIDESINLLYRPRTNSENWENMMVYKTPYNDAVNNAVSVDRIVYDNNGSQGSYRYVTKHTLTRYDGMSDWIEFEADYLFAYRSGNSIWLYWVCKESTFLENVPDYVSYNYINGNTPIYNPDGTLATWIGTSQTPWLTFRDPNTQELYFVHGAMGPMSSFVANHPTLYEYLDDSGTSLRNNNPEAIAAYYYMNKGAPIPGIETQPNAVLPSNPNIDIADYMPAWDADKKTFKAVSYDEDRHIEGLVDVDFYPVTLTGVQGENQDVTTPQDDAITGDAPSDADMDYIFPAIQDFYEFIHNYPNYPDIVIPAGDSGDTPTPTPPVITGAGSDLIAIYNPTKQEIKDFNQFLWDLDPTNLTNWKKVIANPIDAVISLHMIYVTPITGEPRHIKCGYIETDVSSKIVTNQYKDVDCGEVNLTEYFSNVWDYIDTDVQIYLPFIGIVPLDTREIMNSILKVMYRVDVYTGTCLAQIIVQKDNSYGVLYTYTGNCAVPLPLTSGSFTGVFSTLLSACGTAVFGGGPAMAAGEVAGDLLKGRVKQNIQRSGSIGANAGAMGIRTPYLIITRPIPYDASEYSKQYGYPLNQTVVIGNLNGYTRVKDIHLHGIPCTDDELEMIERLLKDGVIIN